MSRICQVRACIHACVCMYIAVDMCVEWHLYVGKFRVVVDDIFHACLFVPYGIMFEFFM